MRSERIADLKLVYSGEGPVSRNLGRSFFSWLLEWLWPFWDQAEPAPERTWPARIGGENGRQ